jgi:hypothetical protein
MDSLLIKHVSGQAKKAIEKINNKNFPRNEFLTKVRHMTHFSVLNNTV